MLDTETKRRIDTARDILVGKIPNPQAQVEQITIALIYKFMDDMDAESEEWGGKRNFFTNGFEKYSWAKLMSPAYGGHEVLNLYSEALSVMTTNNHLPKLFRDIFRNAYLPFRDPETLKAFLKIINEFQYDHSERLGDAFEYLLSILGSQGDAGQFRTPRHIIDFMVEIMDPKKDETILDPACGTAGFLISSWKHILKENSKDGKNGAALTPDDRKRMAANMYGYDISPDMVRLSLVNMYLHGLADPKITEYDTLTYQDNWNQYADVILANPPFMSPKGGIKPHNRFSIHSKRSEVLFIDYIAEHLTPNGRAAVIVPEGVIFQGGKAYKQLRKMLVENYLYAVISLPAGVFNPYSGVKTSILLMDKQISKRSDSILFVKIENDGFSLGAQRNPIKGSQLVESTEIVKNYINNRFIDNAIAQTVKKNDIGFNGEYNLSGDRYKSVNVLSINYESVKLGDICRVINGRAYKKQELLDSGIYPVLRVGNFFSNRDWYYSNLELDPKNYCSKGDLLYAWSASFGPKIWDGDKCIYHYHIWKMVPDESKISKRFLYHILNKETEAIKAEGGRGIGMIHITKAGIEQRKIPLPPLSVQEEIVAEIEGYQKIIDGAQQVVDNWKPVIDIDPEWGTVKLEKMIKLSSGKGLTAKDMKKGEYPVYGGNGINGFHNDYFIDQATIVIGRVGAYCGAVHVTSPKSWVTDNGLYVINFFQKIEIEFLSQMLTQLNLNQYAKIGGQPSISQKTVTNLSIPVPTLETQRAIVKRLKLEKDLVDANKQLIEIYNQKIKDRIAKVWGNKISL